MTTKTPARQHTGCRTKSKARYQTHQQSRTNFKTPVVEFNPQLKTVKVFSDGSCLKNPGGPGGYGIVLQYRGAERELSEGFHSTTNNRMEMMGALIALERLKYPCNVILHSDSQYLKNGMTLWMKGWKRNGWITSEKKPVKNVDLWKRLDAAVTMSAGSGLKVMPVIARTKCVTAWRRSPPTPQLICLTSVTLDFCHKMIGKYLPIILNQVSYRSSG